MKHSYQLSEPEAYGRSLLWQLQADYFAQRGVDAWRQQEVPHYLTCNPRMANSYAEIIFAFWQDQQQLAPSNKPLLICELGAGSGRFAYHLLQGLHRLCQQANVPPTHFLYLLTDVPARNLQFWQNHPHFQPLLNAGLLDFAHFDATNSEQLDLQRHQKSITTGMLERPLIVIANYLFDTIPQELYYFDEGDAFQCLVSLSADEDPATLDPATLFKHITCEFEYQPVAQPPYADDPILQQLFTTYQQQLTEAHLLFPDVGLRCLHRLQALSTAGLLLLTGDKGSHQLDAIAQPQPPKLSAHGSFSLNVNFHALGSSCEQAGGLALFPNQPHNHLNIGCLLYLTQPSRYRNCISAYERQVQAFGPDDFYSISKHARQAIEAMNLCDILAYVRLSLYDAHLFAYYLPRLQILAPELTPSERQTLIEAIDRVWAGYFPIGEAHDLAFAVAGLLYTLEAANRALTYLERSVVLYGEQSSTLLNMALCYKMLDEEEAAAQLLKQAMAIDPANPIARQLAGLAEMTPSPTLHLESPLKPIAPALLLRNGIYGETYAIS